MRKELFTAFTLASLTAGCGSSAIYSGPHVSDNTARQTSSQDYCSTAQCIYVTNGYGDAIDIYGIDAHGRAKPIERIKGPATGLVGPSMIAVDAHHNLYVANVNGYYQASITVYPAGEYGNVAPAQTISGPDSQLGLPNGIAVDSAGNIYVTNWFGGTPCIGSVTEYAAGANGDAAPIAQIKGKKTRLCDPWGTALDANGNIYVTSGVQYSSAVYVYAAGSNGNVAPIARISGKRTLLNYSKGITLDALGNIYVATGDSLVEYRAGAHGDAKPVRAINGLRTKLLFPYGIAVDTTNRIYTIVTAPHRKILVFASDAKGDVPPGREIKGRRFGFAPSDLAVR